MISDYLNLAFRNIKKRRLRAFLTLVGILISIATIFVLISLSLGLEKTIEEQFETLGTDKFFVQPRGQFGPPGSATAVDLTLNDLEEVKKVSGVKDATFYVVGNAKIKFRDEQRFVLVSGVDPEQLDIAFGSYDVEFGRTIRESDSRTVMLGHQYKFNNYLGSPIEVGDKVEIQDVEFKVVGIVEQIGNPHDDRAVYMPEDDFRSLFSIPERIDFIIAKVSDSNEISETAERTEKRLMKTRDVDEKTQDFTILKPEELLGAFGNVLDIITVFLFGIAAISLLVGGINIANTMFTSVIERTKEIGIMKAIGAKNSDIILIFLIEAGLLGLVGGILGVLFGYATGKAIEYVAVVQLSTTLLSISTPAYLVVGSLAFAFLAGAVSGLYPAWRAAKIKPVDALRYE